MAAASVAGARPHLLRRLGAAALLLLLVLLAWTAWALLASRDDVATARAAARTPDKSASADDTAQRLARARAALERVDGRLGAPGPAVVARLPLLGRTPTAARVSTKAALAAVLAGQRVLSQTTEGPSLVNGGRVDPARLGALARTLRDAAKDTAGPVRELQALHTGLVLGRVGSGVEDARERLGDVPQRLASAADALDALSAITGARQPRRLLIALENNAELRGSGGIVTVFAEAKATGGRLQLGRFRDVDDVAASAKTARRVPSPPDYHRLWGPYLADSTLWKNVNMSPDLATSSAVLAGVARATLGTAPDAIVWLDVRTLADVIGATSPARLPDGTVLTKGSTVRALLSGAYSKAVDTTAGQAARRARLRAAADVVAGRILHGSPDAARLSMALSDAARGRHLAVWSAHPAEQRALAKAGLAGDVRADRDGPGGDIASVVVQNFGGGDRNGNKLDYYARRLVSVKVRVGKDVADVEQEISLRNTAPPRGLPVYVAGRMTPGTSNNFLTVAVPAKAALQSFTRGGTAVHTEVLPEGDHRVVTDAVSLAPGTTATWRLRYRLRLQPGGAYTLHAVPQPMAVDAGLHVEITGDGVHLATPAGRRGDVRVSEPFDEQRSFTVVRARENVLRRSLDAVRRFWNEPVHLPF